MEYNKESVPKYYRKFQAMNQADLLDHTRRITHLNRLIIYKAILLKGHVLLLKLKIIISDLTSLSYSSIFFNNALCSSHPPERD